MELYSKLKNPEFIKKVREADCYKKFRDELFAIWEKHCTQPRAALRYSDFKLFWETGDRGVYETAYFSRRLAISAASLLAVFYPEEEKYLIRLMDEIYAICDEYTWCLPAHQKTLEVNDNCVIDLFASETGFALSEICAILGDRLEPLIIDRIKVETERRIFKPFLAVSEYKWWEHGTNNWTSVCTGSVACAFMLQRPDLAEGLLDRFNESMEYYLSGFEDDGICIEGCGYWHYGFGFFTVYADMLKEFTKGRIDWFKNDKVRKVASFIQKMFLSGNTCVSFADGGRYLQYHMGLCHYLKGLYPDEVVVYDPKFSYNYDGCARYCLHLRSVLWINEEYYNSPADDTASAEYYADNSEWFIKRTKTYGFAAKGGNNNEHHNNNDVGAFIYAKNGKQIITDPGAGVYTRQYFDNKIRYSILECSSRSHSVPIIGGEYQPFGKTYASRGTKYENGVFSTDIAKAYKCEELESLLRSFSFTDDSVTLTDKFVYSGDGEITERLVSLIKPTYENGVLSIEGTLIEFDPEVCTLELGEESSNRNTCYFIDFKLKNGVREFTCTIKG